MIPAPDREVPLQILPALTREMLNYCALKAIEGGRAGSIRYDPYKDEVTYHLRPDDLDQSLFADLDQVEEIWIVEAGGTIGQA